ncbi:YdiU family protein [Rickettsiales bacterium]|nr:YdiU family protein [Rickettsiales bacterium]
MKLTNSYYKLGNAFYKKQLPEKALNPELILFNKKLATNLDLDLANNINDITNIFSGNKLPKSAKPISLCYAGHQFGHFVNQLGDGRAILLGEVKDKKNILYDIQLKGSGKTFFSRGSDGKCPLNAAIKEYIISEAMHYLKIPTTRSLSLIKTQDLIIRDQITSAAIITRVAKSHIRIGTFEYFACKKDFKNLQILANYTINRHYNKCLNHKNKYLSLLKSIIKSQANLVSSWMTIGFIHGVMNTDNISISGQTIDYGPCAFMDQYNSKEVFSYIDKNGRYNFSNQKNIILWNLTQFASAILPLINNDINIAIKLAEIEINKFSQIFDNFYYTKMLKKIGIFNYNKSIQDQAPQDQALIDDFLNILEINNLDFTNNFRNLSNILLQKSTFINVDNLWLNWQQRWQKRLKKQKLSQIEIANKMDKINPILIPRNHIISDIITRSISQNNFSELTELIKAIKSPFIKKSQYSKYYQAPTKMQRIKNTFCGT